jgi:hypothetical protein
MRTCRYLAVMMVLLAMGTVACAQEVTGSFAGIAEASYDNTHGPTPLNFNGSLVTGTLVFDGAMMHGTSFGFFLGSGVTLTFQADGQTVVSGPVSSDSVFTASVGPSGQSVFFETNTGEPFGSTLTLLGPHNAFGPDTGLTPTTFKPGPAFLDGSTANFGNREFGATVFLTSLTLTQGPLTVASAVPEPSTYSMIIAGLAMLGFMIWRRMQ